MKLLLHVCCAPDATVAGERLPTLDSVKFYFDNPNIYPVAEYVRRLGAFFKLMRITNADYVEGEYNPESWYTAIQGKEDQPEGGDRCRVCIQFRLERAAHYAKKHQFDAFGTVLSTSPHKKTAWLHELGEEISQRLGLQYLRADFKKQDGFSRSVELSRQYGLYRQNYCGCEYSLREPRRIITGV